LCHYKAQNAEDMHNTAIYQVYKLPIAFNMPNSGVFCPNFFEHIKARNLFSYFLDITGLFNLLAR
jgi:hypothetical protein